MKISRMALIDALTKIKPALATQDFIPVMRHFCFTGQHVYTYSEVNAISVPLETDIKAAVPEALLPIVNSYTSDEVDLSMEEDKLVVKSTARTKATLPVLPASEFLYKPPRASHLSKLAVLDSDMIKGLALCLNNVGDNTMRASLMGITLSPDLYGVLYSTDNVTLSRYRLKQKAQLDAPVILPRFFCQQLATWAPEGRIDISANSSSVVAVCDGMPYLMSHRVQGDAEDFKSVLKRLCPPSAKESFVAVPDMASAVSRAVVVKQAESKKDVRLTVSGTKLTVLAKGQYGRIQDRYTLDAEYDDCSQSVGADLLQRGLKMCDEINFLPDVLALRNGTRFLHLISLLSDEE